MAAAHRAIIRYLEGQMLTTAVNTGRLLEIQWRGDVTLDDIAAARTAFAARVANAPETSWVIVADLRVAIVSNPQTFEATLRLMKTGNPSVERLAFLLERGSLLALRMVQVASAANNLGRKTCSTPAEVVGWVGPLLNQAELHRLREFLG